MIESSELSEIVQVYKDSIYVPGSKSVMKVLSAEAYSKEGLNISKCIIDELHAHQNRDLFDVLSLSMGNRGSIAQLVAITTAGKKSDSTGSDSIAYTLYQYGQKVARGEVIDPSFFMAWWEANPDRNHLDPKAWAEANPGFGDLVSEADFASAAKRTPESEFRTKRCNQWVSTSDTWLPVGTWENCTEPMDVPDGTAVVLAFDGSFNGDCTAIVGVTVAEVPHVFVVEVWEKPDGESADWQVPVMDVEQVIRDACKRWQVEEIACDPYRWARTFQVLEEEQLPVVLFPQTVSRMTPATTRFFEAVMNRSMTHDGDARLSRHVGNATLRADNRGARLAKENKNSTRRIDLAVASVMGFERAAWWVSQGGSIPMVFDPWSMEDS
jgi:phage terminase large subunit-like protein